MSSTDPTHQPNSKPIPKPRIIDGRKTFIPLENNPETLTALSQSLGIAPTLTFHDVLSLHEPALLSIVPRPAHALILLAPAQVYHEVRANSTPPVFDPASAKRTASASPPPWWSPQTIGHACGSMALIHSLFNGPFPKYLAPANGTDTQSHQHHHPSTLHDLYHSTLGLSPPERAQALYDSTGLEEAHMAAAADGSSRAPDPSEPNAHHFISFLSDGDGRVWELEGSVAGPILCATREGEGWAEFRLAEGEDLLDPKAVEVGPGRYLEVAERVGLLDLSVVALFVEEG